MIIATAPPIMGAIQAIMVMIKRMGTPKVLDASIKFGYLDAKLKKIGKKQPKAKTLLEASETSYV
jgi:hypothetical protein